MHISHKSGFLLAGSIIMVLTALPASAQNRIVRGTVVNDKDQPVAGASIQIQSTDSGRLYSTKTDKKGGYVYMGIMAGEYRVVVRAKGFQPEYRPSIKPSIQQDSIVDFKLTPGSENQKLPFEMSAQEIEKIKKEMAKAEKRKKTSGEVQALFNEGLQLTQQSKYEEAIDQFKKALAIDPEQPNIIGNMADAYSKLDNYDEALNLYKQAIEMKPDDSALYTNMGVILSKMGKNAESEEAFKKAAELNPASSAQNFYNIGATLVNNGKPAEAATAFKQAIAADPNFAEAYFQLGICQSGEQETIPEAIKNLQKYIEIGKQPENVEAAKQIVAALQQSLKN